jgi:bifunctional non-homologous end joining protein LigD
LSLKAYQRKRRFSETPEPRGGKKSGGQSLRFVVQEHAARRRHYDFRLELDGVLKSWAVPKGPSLNPADKRLAIMVEDHPLDYRTFEGSIPKGNYGAGTVIVWDRGTYHALESTDPVETARVLREGLQKGHCRFFLEGEKLKGAFALVKLRKSPRNQWLLVKQPDDFSGKADVREQAHSVATGRTLEELGRTREPKQRGKLPRKELDLAHLPRGPMPHHVQPMLATLTDGPFDREGWLFEVKWDGYRAIAEVDGETILLYSRRHLSFVERYAPIVHSLRRLAYRAVLDGEIVVIDDKGRSRFQLLQNYQKDGGPLVYYVFDLLYLNGHDLRRCPLQERKQYLADLLDSLPNVRMGEHIERDGIAFFKAVAAQGLEGVIAKKANSSYEEGRRSAAWLKFKVQRRQEAVIGGFTKPRGSRQKFGALVLGAYQGDDLVYIGHTGGGFTDRRLEEVYSRLEPLIQTKCPFKDTPKTNAPVRWIKPELVCEVTFQEWSEDGHMRFPIFAGLRDDVPARSVRREKAADLEKVLAKAEGPTANPPVRNHSSDSKRRVSFTNLEKVYWPEEGITKGDLIAYYREIAQVILPYLRDRPESMHRHPNGITAKSFFQKDVSHQPPPEWVETASIESHHGPKEKITYLLCQNKETLLYLANLGCIEINPWLSRVGSLEEPDYLVIDLDPEQIAFDRVVEAALATRKVLDQAGAACFCKTSGKTGLHVYVSLTGKRDYDLVRQFAELISNLVCRAVPAFTSVARNPAARQQRVYVDFLQNRRGQTLAAPYSVRPSPGATVSAPLKWTEVRKGLDPTRFTMRTMPGRIARWGDLWKPVLGPGVDLTDCIARLERHLR